MPKKVSVFRRKKGGGIVEEGSITPETTEGNTEGTAEESTAEGTALEKVAFEHITMEEEPSTGAEDPQAEKPVEHPVSTSTRWEPEVPLGRILDQTVRHMLVFGDVVHAMEPDEIFDVLARNFVSNGDVTWWLHKVGYGSMSQYAKGRDVVEYIRKVSHLLSAEVKKTIIGKKQRRW